MYEIEFGLRITVNDFDDAVSLLEEMENSYDWSFDIEEPEFIHVDTDKASLYSRCTDSYDGAKLDIYFNFERNQSYHPNRFEAIGEYFNHFAELKRPIEEETSSRVELFIESATA
jgi:hypothetical protein